MSACGRIIIENATEEHTMPENRRIHKHPMGGLIFASILLLLIAIISLTITLTALSKKDDDPKKDDDISDIDDSNNGSDNGEGDDNGNGSQNSGNNNQSNKTVKIDTDSSLIFEGPLLQLDDSHLYKRPVEELITRSQMANLTAGQLLRDYNFVCLFNGHNGDFILKDRNLFLEKEASDALYAMMAAYVSEFGHKNIYLRNAYYYDKSEDDRNTPDINEALLNPHALGMAIDLQIQASSGGQLPLKNNYSGYPKTEYYDWFVDNCHKFGYIHVISGNESSYSTFRYIGVPHSTYIYENNITFERYLTEIRTFDYSNKRPITADGKNWWVYYVKASDGEITQIPVIGSKYTISGDNSGGFIVTVDQSGI